MVVSCHTGQEKQTVVIQTQKTSFTKSTMFSEFRHYNLARENSAVNKEFLLYPSTLFQTTPSKLLHEKLNEKQKLNPVIFTFLASTHIPFMHNVWFSPTSLPQNSSPVALNSGSFHDERGKPNFNLKHYYNASLCTDYYDCFKFSWLKNTLLVPVCFVHSTSQTVQKLHSDTTPFATSRMDWKKANCQ